MTETRKFLQEIMERYTTDNVDDPRGFEKRIRQMCEINDWEMEGYTEDEKDVQRDLSVKFTWGHNHDFGAFKVDGKMGDRHVDIIATFIDELGLPRDLTGKKVLDVGVWCGGTTLLLHGMGANVSAIEEVRKYADCSRYIFDEFVSEPDRIHVWADSIFDLPKNAPNWTDYFDYIIFPGVLYHLSDMIVGLRILFNALKDGGLLFVETAISEEWKMDRALAIYAGGVGNNWFIPEPATVRLMLSDVGFNPEVFTHTDNQRGCFVAARDQWKPMLRAGLSRRVR